MKLMTDKIELKEEVLELERETSFLVKSNKKKLEKDRTEKQFRIETKNTIKLLLINTKC